MNELVNVLTEDGIKVGRTIDKSDAHKNGVCHGISAIGLINKHGKLLIQKRAEYKKTEPNKWDISAAGHIDYNEDAIDAVVRELYEETGIKVNSSDIKLIDTYLNKVKLDENTSLNHFTYLYIAFIDVDVCDIVMDENEVSEVKFIDKNEFINLLNSNDCVDGLKYCRKIIKYLK